MKKTLILLFAFFGCLISAKAQNWGGGVDESDIHFGFTFQVMSSQYRVIKQGSQVNGTDWRDSYLSLPSNPDITTPYDLGLNRINSEEKLGYGVGFVVNKRLGSYTDLRLTPTLLFSDRVLNYIYTGSKANRQQVVQSTLIDAPLSFKLKSDRRKNFRAYMVGGLKYSMDITSAKKTSNEGKTAMEMILQNKKNFLSYEAGLGMDLYFEYFKMSPEIKYSASFNSILERGVDNPYAYPLDKLMLRHVTFSLFFE
jgi:hypothetical protein